MKPSNHLTSRFPSNLPGTSPIIERRFCRPKAVINRQSNGKYVRLEVDGMTEVIRAYEVKVGK